MACACEHSVMSGMRKQNSSPPNRACKILGPRAGPLLRDQVVGSDLLPQDIRHAFDDPVADRVAERVVVPLEAGDIDEADRAPASALLESEERLELFGEPAEVHQLRLRIPMRLVGQVLDERFEVPRDAADGGVLCRQLGLDAGHFVREAGRQRLDGFVLGFLPEPLVAREHRVDDGQQFCLLRRVEIQVLAHPGRELGSCLGLGGVVVDLVGVCAHPQLADSLYGYRSQVPASTIAVPEARRQSRPISRGFRGVA